MRFQTYDTGSNKFKFKYHGPYEVIERLAPVTYRIKIPRHDGNRMLTYITHVNKLKLYKFRPGNEDELEPVSTREQLLLKEMERSTRLESISNAADRQEAKSSDPDTIVEMDD